MEANKEQIEVNDDLVNLLNCIEIPILILDLKRNIRQFTPKAKTMLNLQPSDIGKKIDHIQLNVVIDNLDQMIREVIEKEAGQEKEVQDLQGRWHRLQIRPYKTADHRVAGAVLSLINVDFLKRAVIDAEWLRDYSANIVEAIQIPLIVLNQDMRVISANQAFYDTFQISKDETESKNFYALQAGIVDLKDLKIALKEMLSKNTTFRNVEVTSLNSKNQQRTLSLSSHPIKVHIGIELILVSIEDVTDQKNREKDRKELLRQAQEAREEADKANFAKDLFLATLSHELRTPLTSLLLQSQMLQRGPHEDAYVKKAGHSIERAALTQSRLIEDLLDVSRIVTGNLKLSLTPVDLKEVIRNSVEMVAAQAEMKSITIESRLCDDLSFVSGDLIRLQQVVWNLLNNSIKFSKPGDSVFVTLTASERHMVIQVTDHGLGIKKEFLNQVFERFSQEVSTSTRVHGGLGLGLAIVRHLVEMHFGTVSVESPGPRQGSTFTVMLPLAQPTEIGTSALLS